MQFSSSSPARATARRCINHRQRSALWGRLGSEWGSGISCASPPSLPPSLQEALLKSQRCHTSGATRPCHLPCPPLPGCKPSTLFMSTKYVLHHPALLSLPETLPHLGWFKQWVRKGRRRCKTLIFVTNDYLQNAVLLQPRLTSKYIQHTVMLPSWLNGELEVRLTGNTSNSFLLAPTLFRSWALYRKGNGS